MRKWCIYNQGGMHHHVTARSARPGAGKSPKIKPQTKSRAEWLQTLHLTTKEYIFMSIMYETPINTGYMLRHRANHNERSESAQERAPLPLSHLWKLKNTSANNSLLLFLSVFIFQDRL